MDDLDHRNLGVKLKLWHLQEDAPGMVFWHPRGYAVYRVLEDYVRRKMRRAGYAEVRTPLLLPQELWGRSGHWDKFGEHMFRVDDGEAAMALKPMSCPCHVQIFNKGLRSWRDLPVRYAEFGTCHRNEPSGALHGLMRTRAFEAILLEHYGGVLPFFLSPEQVAVAPISRDQADYAAEVLEVFQTGGLRAVCYDGAETLSRRIVAARDAAIPVMA